MGKMAVFSAFSFLILVNSRKKIKISCHLFFVFIGQLLIWARAFYQFIYLGVPRIPLSAMSGTAGQRGAATIAAYMITFSAIYASFVILKSNLKYKWPIFFANFILSFSAIVMTGTRSAIFTYPLVTVLTLLINYRKEKKLLLNLLLLLGIGFVLCGFIFKNTITSRVDYLNKDLDLYYSNNSNSSVGARIAMFDVGSATADKNFSWQSLEERGTKIKKLVTADKQYRGAIPYLGVHMHNETIEALSTKGISGVIVLVLFYFSLFYYAIKSKKALLVIFPIAMMLFGISDVIMHAKPIPASWIITLFLSSLLLSNNKESDTSAEEISR
ncbi:O-antigen ligase family protein [Paramixta manurensis]|uniref:O-antigen ligase family protein n=2 Tax=Paramixta manurensis TaxID=2740817 RepID=A0A6M8UJC4_9GAMM|nr:O-antigen ligase family protein [Erwiniaceae bacterium PD-1]